MIEINGNRFVSKFFQMDPKTEDLLSNGSMLKEGMVVMIEDDFGRVDVERDTKVERYDLARALENNRWCTVSEIETHSQNYDIISFVATYEDGTKKKRTFNKSYAWYVKLDSI